MLIIRYCHLQPTESHEEPLSLAHFFLPVRVCLVALGLSLISFAIEVLTHYLASMLYFSL